MSSEFYLKARTLYEEFKKKELHYLKAEEKLNDSLMWKKNNNVPLQDYLTKIQQREKKTEEAYQNVMKQMNELDQRTDLLCSKIEKLGIFRNILVGHSLNDTKYSFASNYIPHSLNTQQNFNTEPTVSNFDSNSLKSSTLKTASTQTENNVYCDSCKSLIQVSPQLSHIQNSTSSTIDILSLSKDEFPIIDSTRLQADSFLDKSFNNSQLITSSLNDEHFPSQICENKKDAEFFSKNRLQSNEKYEAKSAAINKVSEDNQTPLQYNEDLIGGNTVKDSENKQILNEPQSKSNDSEISVEVTVAKSDADSVNYEFDFLESDTVPLSSKIKSQKISENTTVPLTDVTKNVDQSAISNIRLSNEPSRNLKNEKETFQSIKEQEISDNRSETSGSVSGTHSPVISISDSDSVNEKGSFTASAAYQSLLGNTVIPSKIVKQVSVSESEDEVEKTLAHSVKKPNIKSKSSVQIKKDKSIQEPVDSNPTVNRPKSGLTNKPQSKLSKSTKKVLGIDTSSSSDVEAAVKPLKDKKDEDSDEFDFYD